MPLSLSQFRDRYPEYDEVPDGVLVDGLHKKFYPKIPFDDFANKIGYQYKFETEPAETIIPAEVPGKAPEELTATTVPENFDEITAPLAEAMPEVAEVPALPLSKGEVQHFKMSEEGPDYLKKALNSLMGVAPDAAALIPEEAMSPEFMGQASQVVGPQIAPLLEGPTSEVLKGIGKLLEDTGITDFNESPYFRGRLIKELVRGAGTGELPEGLGALQKETEFWIDHAGQYFQTPEEEAIWQKEYPNLMAARYAMASLLPAGEKLASSQDREAFRKLSPEEQHNEILGETIGWALLPAVGPAQRAIAGKLIQIFPWMNAPLKMPGVPNWLRRLTNRERGLAVRSAARIVTEGMSEEEIQSALHNFWADQFKGNPPPTTVTPKKPKLLGEPPAEGMAPEAGPLQPKPKGPLPGTPSGGAVTKETLDQIRDIRKAEDLPALLDWMSQKNLPALHPGVQNALKAKYRGFTDKPLQIEGPKEPPETIGGVPTQPRPPIVPPGGPKRELTPDERSRIDIEPIGEEIYRGTLDEPKKPEKPKLKIVPKKPTAPPPTEEEVEGQPPTEPAKGKEPWEAEQFYHGSRESNLKPNTILTKSKYGDFGAGVYVTNDIEFSKTFADGTAYYKKPSRKGVVYEVETDMPENVFSNNNTILTDDEIKHWENDGEDMSDIRTRADLIDAYTGRNFFANEQLVMSEAWDDFLDKFGYDAVWDGTQLVLRSKNVKINKKLPDSSNAEVAEGQPKPPTQYKIPQYEAPTPEKQFLQDNKIEQGETYLKSIKTAADENPEKYTAGLVSIFRDQDPGTAKKWLEMTAQAFGGRDAFNDLSPLITDDDVVRNLIFSLYSHAKEFGEVSNYFKALKEYTTEVSANEGEKQVFEQLLKDNPDEFSQRLIKKEFGRVKPSTPKEKLKALGGKKAIVPKPKEPEIEIIGTKDKTVSVDISEEESDALSPKEQKKYLLAEIDVAIKNVPKSRKATEGELAEIDRFKGLVEQEKKNLDSAEEFLKEIDEKKPKSSYWSVAKEDREDWRNFEELREPRLNEVERNKKAYELAKSKLYMAEKKAEFGTTTIEVPGDGTFEIFNSRPAIEAFKKAAKSFPMTAQAKTRPLIPSTDPLPGRISGAGVQYYNPYVPKKQGIVEKPKDDERGTYAKDGYISDGGYLIKAPKSKIKGKIAEKAHDLKQFVKDHENTKKPATLVGQYSEGIDDSNPIKVHIVSDKSYPKIGRIEMGVDARYVDSILTEYPDAKVFVKESESPAVFKIGDEIVGMAMPIRDVIDDLTSKGYERVTGKKIKKEEAPAGTTFASDEPKRADTDAQSLKNFSPIPEGLRRSSILKEVSKKLSVPIRTGKFRQRAAGIYKTKPKVIRLKNANDLEVAVHEVGHHIQALLGYGTKMPDPIRQMAYAGAKDINAEGFAEFLRYYVTQENIAKQKAPEFYNEFTERLKDFPDVQDVLSRAKEAWNVWKTSPSAARVHSYIVKGGGKKDFPTLEDIYTQVKDSLYPIKKVVNLAKDRGHKFDPSEDPYIVARLLKGWTRKANQYLKEGTFQYDKEEGIKNTGSSLRKILEPVYRAGKIDLLDTYLVAKRAAGDSRIIRGFSGQLSKEDFAQTVMDLEDQFKDVADELYKYSSELLSFLENSGGISKGTADVIRENNRFYAPLYRVMDTAETSGLKSRSIDKLFVPKKLKGSSRDIYSPTENLIYNTYAIVNSAERHRLGNSLTRLSKLKGMGDIIEKIPFPLEPRKINKEDFLRLLNQYGDFKKVSTIKTEEKEITRMLNNFKLSPSGKMEGVAKEALKNRGWSEGEATQIIERIKSAAPNDRNSIVEKTIEKTTIMMIKEELDLSGMPDSVIHTFRPAYRAAPGEIIIYENGEPRLYEIDPDLKKAIESIDSEAINLFIKVAAFPAKMLRAGATTFSTEFPIRNPIRDQLTAYIQSKYGFVPGVDFIRGLFHILNKTELYKKFNASGAAHSAIVSMDRNYMSKNLKGLMTKNKMIKNPLEMLRAFSELTEEATRMGEFAKGFKKEGGDYQAMLEGGFAAREVSLDFGRTGGDGAKSANMISAFWNARLEGIDKMVRSFKERPGTTALKAFLGVTIPSIVLWYTQKDDPYYNELPTWRRTLFWNVVIHNNDGTLKIIIPIPKPFEWGLLFGSIPEAALDWAYNKDKDFLKDVAKQIGQTLNMIPIPTALIPVFEWWAGKSWFFDRPIVPRSKEELSPVFQFSGHTSETSKLVARGMDKIPGLKEVASPSKIENLIYGYTGGFGRTALGATDKMLKTFGAVKIPPEPTMTLSDIPGIRAFAVRFPSANTRNIEQFYKKYSDLNRKYEDTREMAGIRGKSKIVPSLRVEEKPSLLVQYELTAKALSILREFADITYENKTMTPEKKREALDRIYYKMINVARRTLNKKSLIGEKP